VFGIKKKSKTENNFTSIELLIAAIILGILVSLGIPMIVKWIEKEFEKDAKMILEEIRKAEYDYYIRTESCTTNFKQLGIDNPNKADKFYQYTIYCNPFRAVARRKNRCIQIDLFGRITTCH